MASTADCTSVGEANPDVAGIGILIAFAAQALISLVLSFWSSSLFSKWLKVAKPDLVYAPMHPEYGKQYPLSFKQFLKGTGEAPEDASVWTRMATWFRSDNVDVFYEWGWFSVKVTTNQPIAHEPGYERRMLRENEMRQKKMDIINGLLLVASDAQTLNGISLAIAGLIDSKALTLYHLHVLYDTINFTGISNCAAIFCSISASTDAQNKRTSRYLSIALFALLYLAFSIVFGIRLNKWDTSEPGMCYSSHGIAPAHKHPGVDHIYLGTTCAFFYCALICAIIDPNALSRARDKLAQKIHLAEALQRASGGVVKFSYDEGATETTVTENSRIILSLAMLQFPVHLYFVVALRVANTGLLEGGSEENNWTFGQVVAIVMLGGTLLECYKGVREYWLWKRSFLADQEAEGVEGGEEAQIESTLLLSQNPKEDREQPI
ncbi:hypothetical protein FQN50_006888 [Emmonsiellopsis sp. PD_5]|nr:hypothetical protein FQN50_006888 [Emmonsiellopsis sp. PD_5]